MYGPVARPTALLGIALLAVGLGACSGESLRSRIDGAIVRLDAAVARLGDDLDGGRLRNAELIRQYADRVRDSRPDLRDVVDVLAREGTRNGTMYSSLKTRLDDVRKALPDAGARDEAYVGAVDELNSLAGAVVPAEFDRALADPRTPPDLSAVSAAVDASPLRVATRQRGHRPRCRQPTGG